MKEYKQRMREVAAQAEKKLVEGGDPVWEFITAWIEQAKIDVAEQMVQLTMTDPTLDVGETAIARLQGAQLSLQSMLVSPEYDGNELVKPAAMGLSLQNFLAQWKSP